MVDRRRRREPEPEAGIESFRDYLAIEQSDLDRCLTQQPELFEHVAAAYVTAAAERDALKLDLEEAEAGEGEKIRKAAADAAANDNRLKVEKKERLTEAAIEQKITQIPRIKELKRQLLTAKAEAEAWLALKESFQQRSYMLKELVALYLSRLAGSVAGVRADMGDVNRDRYDRARRGT